MRRASISAILLCGSLGYASAAAAQSTVADPGAIDEADPPVSDQVAPVAWEENDTITVIQRLPYERAGRFYVTAFAGVVPNDPFVVYTPVGLRVGRFFNESLALELSASYLDAFAFDRDLRGRVGRSGEASSTVSLQDHPVARAQCSAAWSLFAAKARTASGQPIYLRGQLLAGFGALLARDATDAIDPRAEGLAGFAFSAQISDTGSVGAEVRQTLCRRDSGGVLTPTEISLAFTHVFGGPLGGVR